MFYGSAQAQDGFNLSKYLEYLISFFYSAKNEGMVHASTTLITDDKLRTEKHFSIKSEVVRGAAIGIGAVLAWEIGRPVIKSSMPTLTDCLPDIALFSGIKESAALKRKKDALNKFIERQNFEKKIDETAQSLGITREQFEQVLSLATGEIRQNFNIPHSNNTFIKKEPENK